MMQINKIHEINALHGLKKLDDNSTDMLMTSPPYWALRDYGIEGQIGLEKTFEEYIDKMCNIFDEVKRVLKTEGTCWVNLGDTYGGANAGSRWNTGHHIPGSGGKKKLLELSAMATPKTFRHSTQEKSLTMIPSRFAIEMCNRGWILRNTIIWHKPNCMPSSAKDRFTVDFEYLFLFVKNKKYFFEPQYEAWKDINMNDMSRAMDNHKGYQGKYGEGYNKEYRKLLPGQGIKGQPVGDPRIGRNKRTVWKISTQPYPGAHFATYPEKLCEIPIKAGCPENGIVLDPFMGAGTTALTALKLNRRFIGFEINPEYIEIANKRIGPYLQQTKLEGYIQ